MVVALFELKKRPEADVPEYREMSYHIQVLTTAREYAFQRGKGRRDLYPVMQVGM